jgi:GMP synthase (glutamine-hydrolysing)
VVNLFRHYFKISLSYEDAEEHFLKKLKGITDPEAKRKTIGREFINIFEREAKKIGGVKYLAQGTLYPDVIESVSAKGPSATIKSHHNVGGLPEKMRLIGGTASGAVQRRSEKIRKGFEIARGNG